MGKGRTGLYEDKKKLMASPANAPFVFPPMPPANNPASQNTPSNVVVQCAAPGEVAPSGSGWGSRKLVWAIIVLALVAILMFVWFWYTSKTTDNKIELVAGKLQRTPDAPCISLVSLQGQIDELKSSLARFSPPPQVNPTRSVKLRVKNKPRAVERSPAPPPVVHKPVIVNQHFRPPKDAVAGAPSPAVTPHVQVPPKTSRQILDEMNDSSMTEADVDIVDSSVEIELPDPKPQYSSERLDVIQEGNEDEVEGEVSNGDV